MKSESKTQPKCRPDNRQAPPATDSLGGSSQDLRDPAPSPLSTVRSHNTERYQHGQTAPAQYRVLHAPPPLRDRIYAAESTPRSVACTAPAPPPPSPHPALP